MDIEIAFQIALSTFPVLVDFLKENSVKYQSHILNVKENARQSAKESKEKIVLIPDEHRIQNPNPSVIFPAIQTLLYYLNEEEIRKLFVNLLSSAYDKRKISNLHPGFINIITQLSPNDARILHYIHAHQDFIGIIAIKSNEEYPLIDSKIVFDIGIEQLSLSMNNLSRLGLLTVDSYLIQSQAVYFVSESDDFSITDLSDVNQGIKSYIIEKGYDLYRNKTYITQLGKSFLKVCVD